MDPLTEQVIDMTIATLKPPVQPRDVAPSTRPSSRPRRRPAALLSLRSSPPRTLRAHAADPSPPPPPPPSSTSSPSSPPGRSTAAARRAAEAPLPVIGITPSRAYALHDCANDSELDEGIHGPYASETQGYEVLLERWDFVVMCATRGDWRGQVVTLQQRAELNADGKPVLGLILRRIGVMRDDGTFEDHLVERAEFLEDDFVRSLPRLSHDAWKGEPHAS